MRNIKIVHAARAGILAAAFILAPGANALEALSPAEEKKFLDWCTGERKASDSVCSCTVKSVATTVPASTLAAYIASETSGSGLSMSNLATQAGATAAASVAQALATCSR